jgi:putative endopeptidase
MTEVGKMLTDVPSPSGKTYLRWKVVASFGSSLSKPFIDQNLLLPPPITGQKELPPRWKRVLGATDSAMGEVIGQLYVEKTFPPEAKQRALSLVKNLQATLRDQIKTLDWMGPATKTQALRKLDAMTIRSVTPISGEITPLLLSPMTPMPRTGMRANDFEFQRDLAKVGKPVDPTEWALTPPTVNAYYNPQRNEIVFPAGILQPPFFDAKADDASNYGAIGMVIGHEMTHGFDDQGDSSMLTAT